VTLRDETPSEKILTQIEEENAVEEIKNYHSKWRKSVGRSQWL
jgi:hypothetical protein